MSEEGFRVMEYYVNSEKTKEPMLLGFILFWGDGKYINTKYRLRIAIHPLNMEFLNNYEFEHIVTFMKQAVNNKLLTEDKIKEIIELNFPNIIVRKSYEYNWYYHTEFRQVYYHLLRKHDMVMIKNWSD